jgi:catechol 2,3-dioxygenase-like lactoylglutathione lyase family enzyme
MKRLHVHIAVDDLEKSIGFYSTLFASEPSVRKGDYAKWMLDDPRVNLAISQRDRTSGIDHLGIQTDTDSELRELAQRLKAAGKRRAIRKRRPVATRNPTRRGWTIHPA